MESNERPTVAVIHLDHLRYNARQLMSTLGENQEILAIVKANAYGHGAPFIARTLEGCGVKKFGVATFSEGLELRAQGIKAEIFVLNGVMGPLKEYFSNRLYPAIFELSQLKQVSDYLNAESREFKICLKFDTGMGRLGFSPSQVDEVIGCIKGNSFLKVACVMTHLAKADDEQPDFTDRQFTLFRKLKDIIQERGLKGVAYSICNSAAFVDKRLDDFHWMRPGIVLYGCYPHPRHQTKIDLKPVLELKTKIISLKKMMPGAHIGYGATFVTQRESHVAILPVGYADGYPRLASNRGHMLVRGQRAPVVGRVSMDLTAIDVTDIKDVALHDDVTVIGQNGDLSVGAAEVATWADTIPYEILCGISPRVPRIYEGM